MSISAIWFMVCMYLAGYAIDQAIETGNIEFNVFLFVWALVWAAYYNSEFRRLLNASREP